MEIGKITSDQVTQTQQIDFSPETVKEISLATAEAASKSRNRSAMRFMKNQAAQQANFQGLHQTTLAVQFKAGELQKTVIAKKVNSNDLIHQAVQENSYEVVRFLIDHGVNINALDSQGNSPLIVAIQKGHNNIARLLINSNADLEIVRKDGMRALELAISLKNEEVAIWLLESTANPNASKSASLSLLTQAISNQMIRVAKLLVGKQAKVNVGQVKESNPLYLACSLPTPQRTEMVSFLLQNKADPNQKLDNQSSVFFLIVEKALSDDSYLNVVQMLCDNKADLYAKNGSGQSPLSLALQKGNANVMNILNQHRTDVPYLNEQLNLAVTSKNRSLISNWIARGAEINNKEINNQTHLYRAVMSGDDDFAQFLVSKGASVAQSNLPPLCEIIEKQIFTGPKLINIADFYLRNGGNPNAVDQNGRPLIFVSVMVGNEELINLLIRHKVNPEPSQKINGRSPVMMAIHFKKEGIARKLIEAKADVNAFHGESGRSVLSQSIEAGMPNLAQELLNRGAEVNVGKNFANNPLCQSILRGDLNFTRQLVEKGADVNRVLEGKNTPLIAAVQMGSLPIIGYLLERGANPNCKNNLGSSPMENAIEAGRQDIVELLLKHGANHEKIDP